MKIQINSTEQEALDQTLADITEDLQFYQDKITVGFKKNLTDNPEIYSKGDSFSIVTIILTLIGTGGAITVAAGKDGFLTKLALILEAYVNRKLEINVETKEGDKISLKGHSKDIKLILEKHFQNEK